MAWVGHTGYGPQVQKAHARARELGQLWGETSQLCRVLHEMSVFHYVRAEHQRARELAEETLSLAQQVEDPLLVALGNWNLGFVLFSLGEYATALVHLEQVIAFYDPKKHHHPL